MRFLTALLVVLLASAPVVDYALAYAPVWWMVILLTLLLAAVVAVAVLTWLRATAGGVTE